MPSPMKNSSHVAAYLAGGRAALGTLGQLKMAARPVSLTRAPPSLQPASFVPAKPTQPVAAAAPDKKSFSEPSNTPAGSEKKAFSDDGAVAALHALGLTPVGIGADALTAPGDAWLMQPAMTAGAAALGRPAGESLGRSLGNAASSAINSVTGRGGVYINSGRIGELLGGILGAGGAAYGARRLGRHLTGDNWEREHVV